VSDDQLPLTEQVNPSTADLDRLATRELLRRINDEDRRVAWAVERELDVIATAVDAIADRVERGGNLHYFGAGTSGRIAAIDAAEIPPTFSFPANRVVAHIAGGPAALSAAVERAEDDEEAGAREVESAAIGSGDAVMGISASGSAPYVIGALRAAARRGALTIAMTSTPSNELTRHAAIHIALLTGPEVVVGSTRLKAGSAQKMALNMMSTAVMIKLGKVHGNLMVDMRATSEKLRKRAQRLTALITGASDEDVRRALQASDYRVKIASVMLKKHCDPQRAEALLEAANGRLREAINRP
jgi:N-acetylmuramic acid 6-phosphate etherase